MSSTGPPIKVVYHFTGPISVRAAAHEGEIVLVEEGESERIELEPETLDIPTRLRARKPGMLTVLRDEPGLPERPVLLASHGRAADLGSEAELLRLAHGAGRKVEIHVYDSPNDAAGQRRG
jgi:hypothetical protein